MNGLINLISPLVQWLFPIFLVNVQNLEAVGYFSLVSSILSPLVILLSLSSKNLFLNGGLKDGCRRYYFHLYVRVCVVFLLTLSSLVLFMVDLKLVSVFVLLKSMEIFLELAIIGKSKASKIVMLLVFISVTVYLFFSFFYLQNMHILTHALVLVLIGGSGVSVKAVNFVIPRISYLLQAFNSSAYIFLGSLSMFMQRNFIFAISDMRTLGVYTLIMQFLVIWSIFLQTLVVQFGKKFFLIKHIAIALIVGLMLAYLFFDDVMLFIFSIDSYDRSFLNLAAFICIIVYLELFFYFNSLNALGFFAWLPHVLAIFVLSLQFLPISYDIESACYIIGISYVVRCFVMYYFYKRITK